MVHTDLHPGNICISEENNGVLHAKVVDLESAVTVGAKLASSPIKYRDALLVVDGTVATHQMDEVIVIAILWCLWDEGSFQHLVKQAADLKQSSEKFTKVRDEMLLKIR